MNIVTKCIWGMVPHPLLFLRSLSLNDFYNCVGLCMMTMTFRICLGNFWGKIFGLPCRWKMILIVLFDESPSFFKPTSYELSNVHTFLAFIIHVAWFTNNCKPWPFILIIYIASWVLTPSWYLSLHLLGMRWKSSSRTRKVLMWKGKS